jgi:8-oxo-dGTP pyrophosphatase MutT (NUDIX family)
VTEPDPSAPADLERLRRYRPRLSRGDHDLNPDLKPLAALRPAAVLVPIVRRPEGDAILLTLRTPHLAAHAGQIAFPGGGIDPGDADPLAAALRETEEEIGLTRDRVEILGRLDTYVSRTGFEIQPFVGLLVPPFETAPDPFEVAEIFEVPLAFILAPGNPKLHRITVQGWSGSITLSPIATAMSGA